MTIRALTISAVAVAALIGAGMAFGLSFERAAYLAPVLVVVAGGVAFIVVLWTKVIYEAARRRRGRASSS